MTVVRAGPSEILVSIKEEGSNLPPREQLVGADWSRVRNVDGKQIVVNRPLQFPLVVGNKWEVDYIDDHTSNPAFKSEHIHDPYVVSGWETVTVPAGTFKALKIEADGEWTAELAPRTTGVAGGSVDARGSTVIVHSNRTTPQQVSGRLYKAFWYAPEVKRFVKTEEEYFNTQDVLGERDSDELESYKVSKVQ